MIGTGPLIETVPLYRDSTFRRGVMTQFDMRCIEKLGLIKFDFLGLKTLTTISPTPSGASAIAAVPDFDIEKVAARRPQATYELLASGNTEGVFQVESGGMTDLVVKLQADAAFKELIPIVALYRPGPLGLRHGGGFHATAGTA